ncbi:MAG: aminopeptidase, partial [Candidatus Zixiibacteriota bacterium]
MDSRIERLAKVLIHYSLKLKKGQIFRISGGVASMPLIKA